MTPAKDLIKTLKVGDRVRFIEGAEGEVRLRESNKWIWLTHYLPGKKWGTGKWATAYMDMPCEKIEPVHIHGQGKADKTPVPKPLLKQDRVGVSRNDRKEFPAEKNSPECCSGRPLKPKEIVLEGEIQKEAWSSRFAILYHGGKDCMWIGTATARKLNLKDGEKVKIRIGGRHENQKAEIRLRL